jgi:hypothetical protein
MQAKLVVRSVAILIAVSASARVGGADQVVARGDVHYLFLQGGTGSLFQTTIGYGSPANTIGNDVWFDGIGVYDVSTSDGFPGFLQTATNGLQDAVVLTMSDLWGHNASMVFGAWWGEEYWLGHYPDLTPLQVTGGRLAVESLSLHAQGVDAAIRWEFLGIPEPATLTLLTISFCCVAGRRGIARGSPDYRMCSRGCVRTRMSALNSGSEGMLV